MCGISTYYRKGGLTAGDLRQALKALEAIRHRGPDGEGVMLIDTKSGRSWSLKTSGTPEDVECQLGIEDYEDRQADLVLGHRRLSIFDLSSRGHQPMRDHEGNVLVLNGEVYNFLELREELKGKGHSFHSDTDTEVILAAYREWGPECLRRFNGMWGILLFDVKKKSLLVTNDRIGIKQLYRYADDEMLIIASEIKAIRSILPERPPIDRKNVRFFLDHGQMDFSSETLFEGIHRFPAAHYLLAHPGEHGKLPERAYWEMPRKANHFKSAEEAAEALRVVFDDAIRIRMRSDVPWGTTLSGGLDSSAIVYAAHGLRNAQNIVESINTFTAIFPGQDADESHFVRILESDLGLNARYTNPFTEFDFDDFERFLRHQDLPVATFSPYAQWQVMRMVGDSEVKVLLDGQGGDELFAGYHHHFYKYGRDLVLRGKLKDWNRLVENWSRMKDKDPKAVKKVVRDDIKLYMRLKLGHKLPGPPLATEWNAARRLPDVLRLDISAWVMPTLLRYEDRNSMAFGIEARLPFLDYRMVEFAMALPDEFKIREGWQKYLLRLAMKEMPDSIRWRKDKKGFTVPQKEWMEKFRERFLAYARITEEAGIALPGGAGRLEDLNHIMLFRLASLGAWLEMN